MGPRLFGVLCFFNSSVPRPQVCREAFWPTPQQRLEDLSGCCWGPGRLLRDRHGGVACLDKLIAPGPMPDKYPKPAAKPDALNPEPQLGSSADVKLSWACLRYCDETLPQLEESLLKVISTDFQDRIGPNLRGWAMGWPGAVR